MLYNYRMKWSIVLIIGMRICLSSFRSSILLTFHTNYQKFGTAFPDMVIGIMSAFISLQVRNTDYVRAINLAIIAASTTFGSNIYNIVHAVWCIYRQNLANLKHKAVLMFPPFKACGSLKPIEEHDTKPSIREVDGAIRVLTALTLLTAFVAISMVLFGQVKGAGGKILGDLYQLILPAGIALFLLCAGILFYFRKSHRPESPIKEIKAASVTLS